MTNRSADNHTNDKSKIYDPFVTFKRKFTTLRAIRSMALEPVAARLTKLMHGTKYTRDFSPQIRWFSSDIARSINLLTYVHR